MAVRGARGLLTLMVALLLASLPTGSGLAQRGEEPPPPVVVATGPQQLPWAWVEVQPPAHWDAVARESLTRLAFQRREPEANGENGAARAWVAQLAADGSTDPLERIQRTDVQLDGPDWNGWRPRAPRRVQAGAQEFAELRNRAATPQRVVALTLHGDVAVVLVVDGGDSTEWLRSGTFEWHEPVDGLRGRLAFPASPAWQVPVPHGYEVERVAPQMLALRHAELDAEERVVMHVRETPHALDLSDAFAPAERALEEALGLRRRDAEHMPLGRLDGLLASCTFVADDDEGEGYDDTDDESSRRRAWLWWGYDPASRTLLTVLHEHHAGSKEMVRQRLTERILKHLRVPEPAAPHARLARIVAVRVAAQELEDGSCQLGLVFVDDAGKPVVFRGFPFEARLTYANRPLPGMPEVVQGSESGDVLPTGLRAPQLRLSPAAFERLRELTPQSPVTVEVRFADGLTVEDEVPLGVLLAD